MYIDMLENDYKSVFNLNKFSDFLEFIELKETKFKGQGDTLTYASELYAKAVYEGFIKANI
jgi:hypothetical protein